MNSVPPAHRAQRLAFRALARMRGEAITYYVNADTAIVIDNSPLAVLSRATQQAEQFGSVNIQANFWDWLISPDKLDLDPEPGHWIIRHSDGKKYRVQSHDKGEKVWRWSDGSNAFRRIHVHEV